MDPYSSLELALRRHAFRGQGGREGVLAEPLLTLLAGAAPRKAIPGGAEFHGPSGSAPDFRDDRRIVESKDAHGLAVEKLPSERLVRGGRGTGVPFF
jgi:hypothetical protein